MKPDPSTFQLSPIRKRSLPEDLLAKPIDSLRELTSRFEKARGTDDLTSRLDELRERLQQLATDHGGTWKEATDVPKRQWALLNLYLLDLGTDGSEAWLPPFSEGVLFDILGADSQSWHPSHRRLATQLFFTQFDRIECLEVLSIMLREAWADTVPPFRRSDEAIWAKEASGLFAASGPQHVDAQWTPGESVDELANHFHIHEESRFRIALFEAVVRRLEKLPFGDDDEQLFHSLIEDRDHSLSGGTPLGARAVEIMIKRVVFEGKEGFPPVWARRIVPLSCDPRIPNVQLRQKWWGWASLLEKETAIRALAELNIKQFIKLLDESLRGTAEEHQFKRRKDCLLALFKERLILDARLVIDRDLYKSLDRATRASLNPSQKQGGPAQTSIICLKCANNVYLIEGTHSFGLRGYVDENSFPIKNFWSKPPQIYEDSQLRTDRSSCHVYQVHHRGDWVGDFLSQLRKRHIEWPRLAV